MQVLRGIYLAVALGFTCSCYSQSLEKERKQAFEFLDQKNYSKAFELAQFVHQAFPEDMDANILCAFSLINLGRANEAGVYINTGLQVDPTNFSLYIDAAYYFAASGDEAKAKEYLVESMKVYPEGFDISELQKEFTEVGKNVGNPQLMNALSEWYVREEKITSQRYTSLQDVSTTLGRELETGPDALKVKTKELADNYVKMGWPEMALAAYSTAVGWLRGYGYLSDALEMAQAGYLSYQDNGSRSNTYLPSQTLKQIMQAYSDLGNDERALQYLNEVVALSPKVTVHVQDVLSLIEASASYWRLNKNDEARNFAQAAYKLAEQNGYGFGMASAANSLCAAYSFNRFKDDVSTTIYYGETALQISLKYGFEDLTGAIISNLALGYWKLGTTEGRAKCLRLYGSLVKIYRDKKQYSQASLTLNNVGTMFFVTEDFAYAAQLFEESISLGEMNLDNLSYADRLTFYQSQISAYQFLTVCYARLNNVPKAFEMMEGSRSRVLAERLGKDEQYKKASISDIQSKLDSDEACIMYSLFSGHEVTILVITKKYSSVVFNSDNSFIGDIKDKYLSRMNKENDERKGLVDESKYDPDLRVQISDFNKVTQLTRKFFENPGLGDNVLDEYLKGYYKFLILPVANRLTGIKKLLISPDDVLNYIPYEALKLHDGKYLVEKYDVKYLPSVSVQMQLQQRNYREDRKPLLAMGGAQFSPMKITPPAITSQADLNRLQFEVEENVKMGKSQRSAYAALFGTNAMNFLPGTVEEVKNVAALIPNSKVLIGEEMTENYLKQLSRSGELKNYKVLHLATHGFVVNQVPVLSGVAMSIFEEEMNGEDGFLNMDELSKLQLNTDLTVLSACQTALGKIYSGEGVTGLTQSLLLAGSKAALVSLWPVNDTSTMLFMTGLYKESAKGKPYVAVINDLKRKFIKGEFGEDFKHPNYWAPFIYYGN